MLCLIYNLAQLVVERVLDPSLLLLNESCTCVCARRSLWAPLKGRDCLNKTSKETALRRLRLRLGWLQLRVLRLCVLLRLVVLL